MGVNTNIFLAKCFYMKLVHACVLSHFSQVQLFVILWTVAHQVPLSMGFQARILEWVCHAFLQRIFLTQGSNALCILHWQAGSLPLTIWEAP